MLGILGDRALTVGRDGQCIIADKNYYGHSFEPTVCCQLIECLIYPQTILSVAVVTMVDKG